MPLFIRRFQIRRRRSVILPTITVARQDYLGPPARVDMAGGDTSDGLVDLVWEGRLLWTTCWSLCESSAKKKTPFTHSAAGIIAIWIKNDVHLPVACSLNRLPIISADLATTASYMGVLNDGLYPVTSLAQYWGPEGTAPQLPQDGSVAKAAASVVATQQIRWRWVFL